MGIVGNLWGSAGDLTVTEGEEELATTSPRMLADQVHACSDQWLIWAPSAQVVIPTSGFAHLKNHVGGAL